jgi:hypothetical protein
MRVDHKWVERNLGLDPIATPPPEATFASPHAAKAATPDNFQREIIDFDSESLASLQRWRRRFTRASAGGVSVCSGITCWTSIAGE